MIPVQTGLFYPWMNQTSLHKVLNAFQSENVSLYFVGGCVRDSLLGKTVKDIDLTTPSTPDTVISILNKHNINYAEIGKAYGSIMAIVNGQNFEITSFRHDTETDGRWTKVRYTENLIEDSSRRDFTVNALYLSADGNLYNPQHGLKDITHKHLKFIGDPIKRVHEDYLRILRFFRFYTEFDQNLSYDALQACKAQAHNLSKISKERIYQELMQLLAAPRPLKSLQLMDEFRILNSVINVELDIQWLERLQELEIATTIQGSSLIRLYILFSKHIELLVCSLPFSKIEKKFLLTLQNEYSLTTKTTYLLYYCGIDKAQAQIFLHASNKNNTMDFHQEWHKTLNWQQPKFPLNSYDIIQLGYKGADIGLTLKAVERWWVQQEFKPSRTACLDYVVHGF